MFDNSLTKSRMLIMGRFFHGKGYITIITFTKSARLTLKTGFGVKMQGNGSTMKKGSFLIGYVRVSKADDQDTAACARPVANESSRRRCPAAARDRGARLGRPAKLTPHQQQEVIRAVREGSKTAADAARLFGLHRSNITRLLERSTTPTS